MEMAGRGFSDLYRNTSEEMILKSLMENPLGASAPSMEMLGFKNLSQTIRGDSEELFNSWLLNGEIPGFSSGSLSHRTRQSSRRILSEHAASSQQNGLTFQNKNSNASDGSSHIGSSLQNKNGSDISLQNQSAPEEQSNDQRSPTDKGMPPSNLYLAKAWFQSTQPMTRSRSSELRRRYAAMQNSHTPTLMGPTSNSTGQDASKLKQEFGSTGNYCDLSMGGEMPTQLHLFMSPSNSSSSPFNTTPMAAVDTVSSVVSMLKGTIERKKLDNQMEKQNYEGSSFEFYPSQVVSNMGSDRHLPSHVHDPPRTFPMLSGMQMNETIHLSAVERSGGLNLDGFVTSNQRQSGMVSQEPSQSESSAAAPGLSTGFEGCDGPAQSAQTLSVCESSRRHFVNGTSERGSKAKEMRDKIFESTMKDDHKKGNLVRMGSVSSGLSGGDKGDPTKKRRVERSRKMAEAKERNSTPALPSDMQSVLKRCENLEKEVRSLKLNLSFMNRKDSEQTKQIEELQKQNEELGEEKERLLEEIERIISETGRM